MSRPDDLLNTIGQVPVVGPHLANALHQKHEDTFNVLHRLYGAMGIGPDPMTSVQMNPGQPLTPATPLSLTQPEQTLQGAIPPDANLRSQTFADKARHIRGQAGTIIGKVLGVDTDQLAEDESNGLLRQMLVYHGSRADFDEFDIRKIGTGQGAQSYGHGIYVAENPGVAKQYMNEGRPYFTETPYTDGQAPKRWKVINTSNGREEGIWTGMYNDEASAKAAASRSDYRKVVPLYDRPPSFYKANLADHDVSKMLDWDKPVKESLTPDQIKKIEAEYGTENTDLLKGYELYRDITANTTNGQQETSAFLKSIGVPGVKYLDAGSRGLPLPYTGDPALLRVAQMHFKGNVPYDEAVQHISDSFQSRRLSEVQHAADYAYGRNAQPTRNFVVFDPDKSISGLQKTDPNLIQGEIQP